MEIVVLGTKVDTKYIGDIYDCERDKKMFFNREAGFIIKFLDGSKMTCKESIPYESYPSEISDIKNRWSKLQKEITDKWHEDGHGLPEFGF